MRGTAEDGLTSSRSANEGVLAKKFAAVTGLSQRSIGVNVVGKLGHAKR